MYGKLKITAKMHVLTGLHIGGSSVYSPIGAVDSPVVRDMKTQLPILPGTSIKGKLRTLMARNLSNTYVLNHHDDDPEIVARLFGTPQNKAAVPTRLQFADCFILNAEELREIGYTEVKFENTIQRLTAVAMPRQIERVIRGTVFGFNVIYDIVKDDEITADLQNLAEGLKLLQMDYLGGHGTRGYGKVAFSDFTITAIGNCIEADKVEKLSSILKEVENGALLSV